MTHSLEYMEWCLERLSPYEYVTYLAIQEMYFQDTPEEISRTVHVLNTTHNEIAGITKRKIAATGKYLQRLQEKGFVRYISSNSDGTDIIWVRRTVSDKVPSDQMLRKHLTITLKAPNGKIRCVYKNRIAEFCREQNLDSRALYRLKTGKLQYHRGWRFVKEDDVKADAIHTSP